MKTVILYRKPPDTVTYVACFMELEQTLAFRSYRFCITYLSNSKKQNTQFNEYNVAWQTSLSFYSWCGTHVHYTYFLLWTKINLWST